MADTPRIGIVSYEHVSKQVVVAGNACAGEDELAEDGKVYGTDRMMFGRAYLTQLQRATADGVLVKGYFYWFYWSSMDNLEWTAGFGNRYGIVCRGDL